MSHFLFFKKSSEVTLDAKEKVSDILQTDLSTEAKIYPLIDIPYVCHNQLLFISDHIPRNSS